MSIYNIIYIWGTNIYTYIIIYIHIYVQSIFFDFGDDELYKNEPPTLSFTEQGSKYHLTEIFLRACHLQKSHPQRKSWNAKEQADCEGVHREAPMEWSSDPKENPCIGENNLVKQRSSSERTGSVNVYETNFYRGLLPGTDTTKFHLHFNMM